MVFVTSAFKSAGFTNVFLKSVTQALESGKEAHFCPMKLCDNPICAAFFLYPKTPIKRGMLGCLSFWRIFVHKFPHWLLESLLCIPPNFRRYHESTPQMYQLQLSPLSLPDALQAFSASPIFSTCWESKLHNDKIFLSPLSFDFLFLSVKNINFQVM